MCPGDPGVNKVVVGLVLRPVGLKGELKVRPLSDNPDRYAVGRRLWLAPKGGEARPFTIADVREQKGNLVVSFEGIETVEDADACRDAEIYVPEDEVPPLPEGEYYHYQVIGLSVYTHDGRLLGKVTDIFPAGEKDVYVVKGRGKEYLIPVTGEHVKEIDVKGGRILLNRMEGYIP